MSGSRRTFLQYLGAGALGTTAALLPSQAQAFHFGRNRRTCEVEVEVVPPCCGAAGGVLKARTLVGVASISYPQPGGDQTNPQIIFGGNAFCAWGYLNNQYSLTAQVPPPPPPPPGTPPPPPPPPPPLQLFGTNGVVVPATIQMMPPGVIAGLTPCTWAFTIDQVPSGTIFVVQLNYVSNSNPTTVKSLQTPGYFACGGT